ncbi:MAG: hypothetical protein A3K90_04050 [Pelodictyon luteolum]|uniref:Uncharacterized protein n=2 Tax=Pelodictyon luteolum TaxID=1100 RepID=A0A165M1X0_PELLU|nr:MAG: hypothetical protein A3K90_04050 [Pelodictyon luteolum]
MQKKDPKDNGFILIPINGIQILLLRHCIEQRDSVRTVRILHHLSEHRTELHSSKCIILDPFPMEERILSRMSLHCVQIVTAKNTMDSSNKSFQRKTEFQLLNALLSEMASGLQLTEYRMLEVFCRWLGKGADAASVIIQYPEKFELRDRQQDLNLLKEAGGPMC